MKFLLLVFLTLSAVAHPTLAQDTQTRQVSDFYAINLQVPAKVYLSQGPASLRLEGEDLDKISTEVKGNRLTIKRDRQDSGWFNWTDDDDVVIYISLPQLQELRVSGSGSVVGESRFRSNDLKLHISGSGSLALEVEANEVEAHISGSGSVQLTGNTQDFEAHISGSGRVKAQEMRSQAAEIRISGSGNCYVSAKETLAASISGSGSVYYNGSPATLDVRTSGSGRVKKI